MSMIDLKQKFQDFFNLKSFFGRFWPFIGFLVLALVFFFPVWAQNKVPLPADALVGAHVPWTETVWEEYPAGIPIKNLEITDSFSQFFPWRSLAGDFWKAGKPPLWNPYMFSGTPFLATLHSAALYPLNVLYLFFSDINAWTGLIFLQVFLSATFMYVFLKNMKLGKAASFLGATAFAFSGYMIAWLEFATGGHAGLWLPLLLLFELKLVKTRKFLFFIPIAGVFFFIYTAGDFQVPLFVTITYFLFGFYLAVKKKNLKLLLFILFGWLAGVFLSSPQLLPTFELFFRSVRLDDPYIKEYFFGLMHWEKIVNFIWPDFFGNVVTRNYWGKFGYHEYLAFGGVTTLVFVFFGLFTKKIKHEVFFWFLLLVSLVFLFPTPLAFLPYRLEIPGLGTSSASRIIFIVNFCLATLCAYGFSKWTRKKDPIASKIVSYLLILTLGVALGLGGSIRYIQSVEAPLSQIVINLKVALRNMIPSTLILFALASVFLVHSKISRLKIKRLTNVFMKALPFVFLLISSVELLRFALKNTPFSPRAFVFPQTKIISYLQNQKEPLRIAGGIPLNLFMPFKVSSAEGYDPIYPQQNSGWFSIVNSGGLGALSGRYGLIHSFSSPLLDYANVKYVIDYKKNIFGGISKKGKFASGIEAPRYERVFTEGRIHIFENTKAMPRAWLSTNYRVLSPDNLVEELIIKENERIILLEVEPGVTFGQNKDAKISDFNYELNQISLYVESTNKTLLFLSESFDPAWKAYVDGKEVEVMRANYIFQAIVVPGGKQRIEFIYDPKSFKIGKRMSFATSAFLLTLVVYDKSKKRRGEFKNIK